ncbi:lactonase family protein [Occallatibacter riparius]|uniref:Lactonase family protein n=1 Tax=Occallatibacter riparius TaxID=1002689 RepID=A0A9J7BVS6_9BACT|nr:lactonase family protein [Occallatibacter riparius]UWZ86633.1 lactonase family protein [Occallatibacter riparius]
MKFNKSGQLLLVAAASLGVASLLTACDQFTGSLTVDFVYVTSARAAGPNQYGEVDVFEINQESGRMRQIPTSPFPSGGRNPVAEATHPDEKTLYVVNRDDNTIVQFAIGTDGKLYPQNTVNTPGIFPVATAVAGTNLFVADTYEPLPTCSPASPCTGSVAAWPIKADDSLDRQNPFANTDLGTNYWPLIVPGSKSDIVLPVAIAATSSEIYVAAYDTTANAGYVFAFAVGSNSLTPLNGGVPTPAGIHPSAITADPSGSHLYVTDQTSGNVHGFSISGGALTPIAGSPFVTGNAPSAIVVDKTGKLAYVANSSDSTISGFTIAANGALASSGTFPSDTQPVAIGIDPAMNQYLFTANFLANTVSGYQINAGSGALLNSQFSPYTANANPTAVAAVSHATVSKK